MNPTLTSSDLLDDPATREADARAIEDAAFNGQPLDPAIAARVRARADRVRETAFQRHGLINVLELLRQSRDDE